MTPITGDRAQHATQTALAAGIAHYKAGRFKEAAPALEQAKSTRPQDARTLAYLGAAYYHLRRYHEAAAEFSEAAALRGDDPRVFFDLGNACLGCGLLVQARHAFAAALRADPNYVAALFPLTALDRVLRGAAETSQRPAK